LAVGVVKRADERLGMEGGSARDGREGLLGEGGRKTNGKEKVWGGEGKSHPVLRSLVRGREGPTKKDKDWFNIKTSAHRSARRKKVGGGNLPEVPTGASPMGEKILMANWDTGRKQG